MRRSNKQFIIHLVNEAFLNNHQGHSTDDVVICDRLNEVFIADCRERFSPGSDFDFNWALLNMRKAHRLGRVTQIRSRLNHNDYVHASEIAARLVSDSCDLTIDRILCYPQHRSEFDSIAREIAPDVATYMLRKAALYLRKNRKLRPELIVRVGHWNRQIQTIAADELLSNPDGIPRNPGIYIFRDTTGYLYIGETENLRLRVPKHLDHSDRKSLAHYFWQEGTTSITVELHIFDANSDGRYKPSRRAYESDLIQSRNPRLNLRP